MDIETFDDTPMRYSQIRQMDISNGEAIGVALFTQGCPFHCFNCFNSETWDFALGKEYTEETEHSILECMKPDYIHRITLLGGEPLVPRNIEPLTRLLTKIRSQYPTKRIWMYTGRRFEEANKLFPDLVKLTDVLIDGRFVDSLKDDHLKWRGSSNQRVINVQETLKNGEIVLYCS